MVERNLCPASDGLPSSCKLRPRETGMFVSKTAHASTCTAVPTSVTMLDRLSTECRFCSQFCKGDEGGISSAIVKSRQDCTKRRPTRDMYLKPAAIGAAMTLTFSSPVLPGGPKAAVGSATVLRPRCCSLRGSMHT